MRKALLDLADVPESEITLQTPREASHGDFSTNIALKLSKRLQKNPRQIAEAILKSRPKLGLKGPVGPYAEAQW